MSLFYDKLMATNKMDPKIAWFLVASVVRRVIMDLGKVRSRARYMDYNM
jgi:hypothetical protein